MSIEIRNLNKTFGTFPAVRDVSLKIETGQLVALLGPSGSGKSTLLRMIAGLEKPDNSDLIQPEVLFEGVPVGHKPVRKRGVGFVFQHYSLFRHMTVFENVAFGLRVRPGKVRPARGEIDKKVRTLLELIQLQSLAGRYPHQLSGGQRQRVALARALAVEPQVLLLDEPFGALDAQVRVDLRTWLRKLHNEINVTSVFVTHDQEEALEIADRVIIMNKGRIEQDGTPYDVFHAPETPFVMGFIGNVNIFRGSLNGSRGVFGSLTVDRQNFPGGYPSMEGKDVPAEMFVRPHEIELQEKVAGPLSIPVRIVRVQPAGALVRIELRTEKGEPLMAEISHDKFREDIFRPDSLVFAELKRARVFSNLLHR
ncbi:sulfate transport system ATP-binding protein [Alkalispirochaeta americana]|uniref:Sulfate transport system ATP-binding protein n=1 Tax=Alkalispirochaeta americana TaxID=159291 RepID=A0A1N6SZX0_9SPIO|nr:sulfate ABC transporter ATP-binding protein [Alkalispirochaeta americana]SIQ46630.1 sulfate transport system ATP-binding protein [Alkalispirochaeta americana]